MDIVAKISIKKALKDNPEIGPYLNSANPKVVARAISTLADKAKLPDIFINTHLQDILRFT